MRCAVPRCGRPVRHVSSYCRRHDDTNTDTGHPEGRTILPREIATYRAQALTFMDRNYDHPAVVAALEWIGELIADTAPRDFKRARDPASKLALWTRIMRDGFVDRTEVLATVLAMYALRHDRPHEFKSDRHFAHQLSNRVLRLASRVKGRTEHHVGYRCDRISVPVREYLARRIMVAIGATAERAARVIVP